MPSAFGYELDCELPLPRARRAPGPRGTLRIRRGPPEMLDEHAELIALDIREAANGEPITFAIARAGTRYLLACSVTGAYRLDPSAGEIDAAPTGPHDAWEHRLLAVVVPLLLSQRDDLALHAAVVEIGGRGVLFCGPAGRGKSTLSRAFAELGYTVLSEDGAVLSVRDGEWTVWPGAGGARIRVPGAVGPITKEVVALPGPDPRPLAPGAVVLLDPRGGEGGPRPLEQADALVRLASQLTHAGGIESGRVAFGRLAGLVSAAPACSVSLPDDLGGLPAALEGLARWSVAQAKGAG